MNFDSHILEDILSFAAFVVGIGCVTGIITTWLKYRAKRVISGDVSARLGEIADRMAKLDNAVDSMAVEVERISEGQRFVTKVLAERGATPALPEAARAGGSTPRH